MFPSKGVVQYQYSHGEAEAGAGIIHQLHLTLLQGLTTP